MPIRMPPLPATHRTAPDAPASGWRRSLGTVLTTAAAWTLGISMLPYAVDKVFDLQFQLPAVRYAQPLGAVSGRALTWATMGYCPWYQRALGWFELLPALLLLDTRTRRIGALLMLPVLLNVTLLNFALDLWPETRIISSVLLSLNLFLIACEAPHYLKLLSPLLAPPPPISPPNLRLGARIFCILLPLGSAAYVLHDDYAGILRDDLPLTDFIGQRQINRAGTWQIASLSVGGSSVAADRGTRLYFDYSKSCFFGDAAHPGRGTFSANKTAQTFQLVGIPVAGSADMISGSYRAAPNRLYLQGTRDGQPISLALERDHWGRIH